jgi:hypothetical protein
LELGTYITPVIDPDSNPLCLECGLCCNGVIFADVQLEPADDADRLAALGLRLIAKKGSRPKFHQPCAAFANCRCHVYSHRPKYCREFECLLLKEVHGGRMDIATAQRTIRLAQGRVRKVKNLSRKLGDTDEQLALGKRFRRMKKQLEHGAPDDETAAAFGELTLAFHDLNVLLSESFYSE